MFVDFGIWGQTRIYWDNLIWKEEWKSEIGAQRRDRKEEVWEPERRGGFERVKRASKTTYSHGAWSQRGASEHPIYHDF